MMTELAMSGTRVEGLDGRAARGAGADGETGAILLDT